MGSHPGTWHAKHESWEFIHLMEGSAIITPEGGEPVEVGPATPSSLKRILLAPGKLPPDREALCDQAEISAHLLKPDRRQQDHTPLPGTLTLRCSSLACRLAESPVPLILIQYDHTLVIGKSPLC
ncbi:cupin domain-containing protein [Halopseudomonas pachastrellae]|nr:cupin domain-containing protein [Halopseudomonas pachastrellae]